MSKLTQEQTMSLIETMEKAGMTEDQITAALGLTDSTQEPEPEYEETYNMDFSQFSPDAPFKQKPDKPSFFKAKEKLKKFKQVFSLKSDQQYELNGQTFSVKKLNVRDTMRLAHKTPKWAAYLGYNAPQMLVNEYTGEYRWSETILALFERAFGDYDDELDKPTDFALSVIEEIIVLLGLDKADLRDENGDKADPVDYLLSCDPDEVYTAVATLISYNQTFFLRIWNSLGVIKELTSLIFGKISKSISKLKEDQSQEKKETSLSLNEQ